MATRSPYWASCPSIYPASWAGFTVGAELWAAAIRLYPRVRLTWTCLQNAVIIEMRGLDAPKTTLFCFPSSAPCLYLCCLPSSLSSPLLCLSLTLGEASNTGCQAERTPCLGLHPQVLATMVLVYHCQIPDCNSVQSCSDGHFGLLLAPWQLA